MGRIEMCRVVAYSLFVSFQDILMLSWRLYLGKEVEVESWFEIDQSLVIDLVVPRCGVNERGYRTSSLITPRKVKPDINAREVVSLVPTIYA